MRPLECFNGAATNLSGCNSRPRPRARCGGFNGAAHERERMPPAAVCYDAARASMEPPTNVSGCRQTRSGRRASDASMEPPTNVSGCMFTE